MKFDCNDAFEYNCLNYKHDPNGFTKHFPIHEITNNHFSDYYLGNYKCLSHVIYINRLRWDTDDSFTNMSISFNKSNVRKEV